MERNMDSGKEGKCRNLIDCDARPFAPYGLAVDEHLQGGWLKFNPSRIGLWFTQNQLGYVLYKELEDRRILNANVLDWLIANPHYILKEWKGAAFCGTIYRDILGMRHVRYLRRRFFFFGAWCSGSRLLCCFWNKTHPVAILTSRTTPYLYLVR